MTAPNPHADFLSTQVSESDYFFLDLSPDRRSPFVVTCGGIETCNLDFRISRPSFTYFGLEYIISGNGRLSLGERSYNVRAGSLFCYSPSLPHRIENTGQTHLVKAFIDFAGKQVESVIGKSLIANPAPVQMPNLHSMHELFLLILETGKKGGRNVQETLRHILKVISLKIADTAVRLEDYQTQSYLTYERCLAEISTNYMQTHSISELADSCHVSPAYLSRIFRRFGNESPSEVLLRLKMNRAGELLLKGNLLIKEVAGLIGIEDPYHFSRLFKGFHGVSPKAFRESFPSGRGEKKHPENNQSS